MNDPYPSVWKDDDFESLCWHDNRIHGISFICPDEGYEYDLVLDIDYIVEWVKKPGGQLKFAVAPANLVFHQVGKLLIEARLVYREVPQIDRIDRKDVSPAAGPKTYQYSIFLHSLSGATNRIIVESAAFEQKLRKSPVLQDSQWLETR
jgi:hypothetical protein